MSEWTSIAPISKSSFIIRARWNGKKSYICLPHLLSTVKFNFRNIMTLWMKWFEAVYLPKIALLVLLRKYKGDCPRFYFSFCQFQVHLKPKCHLMDPPWLKAKCENLRANLHSLKRGVFSKCEGKYALFWEGSMWPYRS